METPVPTIKFKGYVDEAGDEGINTGGTEWFVLAAIVLPEAIDLAASHAIDRIKARLGIAPNRPVHWVELRRHEKKKVAVQEIAQEEFTLFLVAFYKPLLTSLRLRIFPNLYFYATRYLMERITNHVAKQHGRVDVVFANRAHLSYTDLETYLRYLQQDRHSRVRNVIDTICSAQMLQRKLLQIADTCAGAAFDALEADRYGNCEESYLRGLAGRLYRKDGCLLNYGIKLFPENELLSRYDWLRQI